MLFLKQSLILPSVCHKSVTNCQIGSNNVSNSKLKPDLCNCVKSEMIEAIAPPQVIWSIESLGSCIPLLENEVATKQDY